VTFIPIVIGLMLLTSGLVVLFDFGGAAGALIRGVSSRNLGSLAPGYAADPDGMRVYALLLAGLGLAVTGVGVAPWNLLVGAATMALGITDFVIAAVVVIAGEVRTYRALPPSSGR